jgi:predicted metalloprotease
MKWRGRRESSNVEDRRGSGGGGFGRGPGGGGFRVPIGGGRRGGGLGIGAIVAIGLIAWALGFNPFALLSTGELVPFNQERPTAEQASGPTAADEMSRFVRVVLAETEDTWSGLFAAENRAYAEPTLVLFSGGVRSACGFASAASGPFYCPGDRKLYIDLSFYEELRRRFAAPGDFAQAYVIAHEVGHHVQNLLGILPKFAEVRRGLSEAEANALSVRVELQADCFAGIWGRDAADKGLLEEGDLDEALNAATQIGDDAIQKRNQGYIVPESFNHGTSAQRARWFKRGYDNKTLAACDTFQAQRL